MSLHEHQSAFSQVSFISVKCPPAGVVHDSMGGAHLLALSIAMYQDLPRGVRLIVGWPGARQNFCRKLATSDSLPHRRGDKHCLQFGGRNGSCRRPRHISTQRNMETIQQETKRQLDSFINGKISSQDLETWIVSIEQEKSLPVAELESLFDLRLLLLESGEGVRPPGDAKSAAAAILREADRNSRAASSTRQKPGPRRAASRPHSADSSP